MAYIHTYTERTVLSNFELT